MADQEHLNPVEQDSGSERREDDDSGMESLFGKDEEEEEEEDVSIAINTAPLETSLPMVQKDESSGKQKEQRNEGSKWSFNYEMDAPPKETTGAPIVPHMGWERTSSQSPIYDPAKTSHGNTSMPPGPFGTTHPNPSMTVNEPNLISPANDSSPFTSTNQSTAAVKWPKSHTSESKPHIDPSNENLRPTSPENEGQSSMSAGGKVWVLNDEKIALIAERDEALRKIEILQKEKYEAYDDIEGMEKSVMNSEQEKEIMKTKMSELEDDLDDLRQELHNAKDSLQHEKDETNLLKNRAHEALEEVEEVKEAKELLQGVVDSLENELEVENRAKFGLVKELEALQEQVANFTSNNAAETIRQELEKQNETINKLEQQITHLQELLTESEKTIETLTSSSLDSENILISLRAEISEHVKKIKSLTEEVAVEKIVAKKIVEDTAERLASKDMLIAEAIQKRFDTKAKAESVMNAIETKAEEDRVVNLETVEKERAQLQKDLNDALKRIHELESLVTETSGPVNTLQDNNTSYQKAKEELKAVQEQLRLTREELRIAKSLPKSTQSQKTPKKTTQLKQPIKPRKVAIPKPTKHYWNSEPSARDPAEPAPTPAMQAEASLFLENPDGKTWPRWFIYRKAPPGATNIDENEAASSIVGNKKGEFDVKRGWKKEVVREMVKKELKPRMEGSRVSVRSNKGVGPERLVNLSGSGDGEREKKRRKVE